MWAVGLYDLRVSEAAFWRLTPRLLSALLERRTQAEDAADWRVGLLAAVLANVHRDPKARPSPYEPSDFFPSLPGAERREQTPEDMLAVMKANAQAMELLG